MSKKDKKKKGMTEKMRQWLNKKMQSGLGYKVKHKSTKEADKY